MRNSILTATVLGMTIVVSSLGAQSAEGPTLASLDARHAERSDDSPLADPRGWLIGVATSARGEPGGLPLFLKAGREWRPLHPALGFRLEALGGQAIRYGTTYYARAVGTPPVSENPPVPTSVPTVTRSLLIGTAVAASYSFRSGRRLCPYVLSGTGLFYSRDRVTNGRLYCDPLWDGVGPCPQTEPGPALRYSYHDTHLGLHGGLGMRMRFGSLDVFLEQEIRASAGDGMTRFGRETHFPLTLGIRF